MLQQNKRTALDEAIEALFSNGYEFWIRIIRLRLKFRKGTESLSSLVTWCSHGNVLDCTESCRSHARDTRAAVTLTMSLSSRFFIVNVPPARVCASALRQTRLALRVALTLYNWVNTTTPTKLVALYICTRGRKPRSDSFANPNAALVVSYLLRPASTLGDCTGDVCTHPKKIDTFYSSSRNLRR
jgi:hypothetical protein